MQLCKKPYYLKQPITLYSIWDKAVGKGTEKEQVSFNIKNHLKIFAHTCTIVVLSLLFIQKQFINWIGFVALVHKLSFPKYIV